MLTNVSDLCGQSDPQHRTRSEDNYSVLIAEVPRPSLFILHSYWGPWCHQEALKERVNIHNRALGVLPLQDRRAMGSRTRSELCWLHSLPKLGRESHAEQTSRDCWALEQTLVMALVMTPLDEDNGNWFIILSAKIFKASSSKFQCPSRPSRPHKQLL